MSRADDDPDFVFFDRDKSHNSSYYNNVPGVKTSERSELLGIRERNVRFSSVDFESEDSDIADEQVQLSYSVLDDGDVLNSLKDLLPCENQMEDVMSEDGLQVEVSNFLDVKHLTLEVSWSQEGEGGWDLTKFCN